MPCTYIAHTTDHVSLPPLQVSICKDDKGRPLLRRLKCAEAPDLQVFEAECQYRHPGALQAERCMMHIWPRDTPFHWQMYQESSSLLRRRQGGLPAHPSDWGWPQPAQWHAAAKTGTVRDQMHAAVSARPCDSFITEQPRCGASERQIFVDWLSDLVVSAANPGAGQLGVVRLGACSDCCL